MLCVLSVWAVERALRRRGTTEAWPTASVRSTRDRTLGSQEALSTRPGEETVYDPGFPMASISVAGFATCPFHQQALAAAKKLVESGASPFSHRSFQ